MTTEEIKTLKWWFDNKGPIYYFSEFNSFALIKSINPNGVALLNGGGALFLEEYHLSSFGQISRFN